MTSLLHMDFIHLSIAKIVIKTMRVQLIIQGYGGLYSEAHYPQPIPPIYEASSSTEPISTLSK